VAISPPSKSSGASSEDIEAFALRKRLNYLRPIRVFYTSSEAFFRTGTRSRTTRRTTRKLAFGRIVDLKYLQQQLDLE
jgi:hypothetical protein